MRSPLAAAACLLATLSFPVRAQEAKPPQHVRGDVVNVNGDRVDVRTRDGRVVHLTVPQNAGVAKVEEADPSAIDDGGFIGVTAVPQPGTSTLRAVEVHVFPESMRGAGEGHRPWDLGTGSSMTNGTVSGMNAAKQGTGSSSMTNGTVAKVKRSGGERTLQVQYQGGEQTVVVPSGVPVVRLAPGDRSLLKPGAHVFAIATEQDGALVAQRLTVGEGAVVPPM
jgi:hypothetical protein